MGWCSSVDTARIVVAGPATVALERVAKRPLSARAVEADEERDQ